MFYIGLLFLPLLWLVNLIYFYPEWKRRNDEGETPSALADQDASPETISDPIANSKINTEPLAPIVGRCMLSV